VDVLVSGIFRSQANAQPGTAVGTNGASRSAIYRMTAAQFLAATGRTLAPGLATQDVDLLLPGAVRATASTRGHALRKGVAVWQDEDERAWTYTMFNSNTPTTYETVHDPATNGANG
jgi:hypothetical protein